MQQVATIGEAEVRSCLESGGHLVLVQVVETGVSHPGTRGAQAEMTVAVEKVVHGSLEGRVQVARYTSGSDPVLKKGKRYMVAVSEQPRFAPRLFLDGFVEVPEQSEQAYVEAHQRMVARLGY